LILEQLVAEFAFILFFVLGIIPFSQALFDTELSLFFSIGARK
jgi:hypothetical protein